MIETVVPGQGWVVASDVDGALVAVPVVAWIISDSGARAVVPDVDDVEAGTALWHPDLEPSPRSLAEVRQFMAQSRGGAVSRYPEHCMDLHRMARPMEPCPNCGHRADAHTSDRSCDVCSVIRVLVSRP